MSAFIGYDDVGVWATNSLRDDFLDWFAKNRCSFDDSRWSLCKSADFRWPGCGVELATLIPKGASLELSGVEYSNAAQSGGPQFAQFLHIIETIVCGEWQFKVDSKEASAWDSPEGFLKQQDESLLSR